MSWKKIVLYLLGQGHRKGLYDQNMTVSTLPFELLILLQPNLALWYFIISQCLVERKKGLLWSRSQQSFLLWWIPYELLHCLPPNLV